MAESSTNGGSRGFFAYYREYAKSGVHAATAAALTALIGLASFVNRWFVVLAIAVYVLPPVFLYLSGEGENVPSVVGDDTDDTAGRESGSVGEIDDRRGDATTDREFETDPGRAEDTDGADTEPDFETGETDSGATDTELTADEGDSEDRHDADTGVGDEPDSGVAGRESAEATETAAKTDSPAESAVEEASDDEPDSDTGFDGETTDTEFDGETTDTEPGWNEADTPTEESLLDVVSTQQGAFAVGESGVVLAHDDEWTIALEDGPTANANPLRGVDATDDGRRVWFAGDSGVLGRYEDGTLTDHSAPEDQTSTWTDVAVTGTAGNERVHLVNGSGELLRGTYDDGSVSWGGVEKPGSGSSISAIAFVDSDRGHICDTNQCVYETTDGGETYEKIGIEDANAAFTGVAAADARVVVACDDGSVFRYDGAVWTRLRATDGALSAIDLAGERGLAAGDGGVVYELTEGSWESVETPTDADLRGVVVGASDDPDIAVGTSGTVIERRR